MTTEDQAVYRFYRDKLKDLSDEEFRVFLEELYLNTPVPSVKAAFREVLRRLSG